MIDIIKLIMKFFQENVFLNFNYIIVYFTILILGIVIIIKNFKSIKQYFSKIKLIYWILLFVILIFGICFKISHVSLYFDPLDVDIKYFEYAHYYNHYLQGNISSELEYPNNITNNQFFSGFLYGLFFYVFNINSFELQYLTIIGINIFFGTLFCLLSFFICYSFFKNSKIALISFLLINFSYMINIMSLSFYAWIIASFFSSFSILLAKIGIDLKKFDLIYLSVLVFFMAVFTRIETLLFGLLLGLLLIFNYKFSIKNIFKICMVLFFSLLVIFPIVDDYFNVYDSAISYDSDNIIDDKLLSYEYIGKTIIELKNYNKTNFTYEFLLIVISLISLFFVNKKYYIFNFIWFISYILFFIFAYYEGVWSYLHYIYIPLYSLVSLGIYFILRKLFKIKINKINIGNLFFLFFICFLFIFIYYNNRDFTPQINKVDSNYDKELRYFFDKYLVNDSNGYLLNNNCRYCRIYLNITKIISSVDFEDYYNETNSIYCINHKKGKRLVYDNIIKNCSFPSDQDFVNTSIMKKFDVSLVEEGILLEIYEVLDKK
jgi:hypothetical protein